MRFLILFVGVFIGSTLSEAFIVKLGNIWFASVLIIFALGGLLFKKGKKIGVYICFFLLGLSLFSATILGTEKAEQKAKDIFMESPGESRLFCILDKVKEKDTYRIYLVKDQVSGRRAYLYGLPDGLRAGTWAEISVEYKEPPVKRNFGDMDYERYLNSRGIHIWLTAKGVAKPVSKSSWEWRAVPVIIRDRLEKQIDRYLTGECAFLAKGMLLGDTKLLPEELSEAFRDGGVSHVLSVSGLHVGYFYLLFHLISGSFFTGKRKWRPEVFLPVGITFFYVILTGFQAPAVRSFFMFAIPKLGSTFIKGIHLEKRDFLSGTGILMLIGNPLLIYDVGFLISFSCIFAMSHMTLGRKLEEHPVGKLFAGSALAWLGSLPFILWSFGRVTVSGLISNLPIIPLSGICTIIGILAILTSLCSNVIGGLLFWITGFLLKGMILITRLFADIFPVLVIPRLPFLICAVGAVLLAISLLKIENSMFRRRLSFMLSCFLCLQLCLGLLPNTKLKMYFLDVGQGDSTLVEVPFGGQMLIDGGGDGEAIVKILNQMGYFRIDTVMISHEHADHAAGALQVIETYRPYQVIIPSGCSEVFLNELERVRKIRGFQVLEVKQGDRLCVGNVDIFILSPESGTSKTSLINSYNKPQKGDGVEAGVNENGEGIVCLVSYKRFQGFFTADTGVSEEQIYGSRLKDLMAKGVVGDDRIEVLKVPHHGSRYSSSPEMVSQLCPSVAIISVGRNRYGHPSKEVISKFEGVGTSVFRTDRRGAIRIVTDGKAFQVSPVR